MIEAKAMPAFIAFSSIAALTWFFSYRPRLFVKVFVPRDEFRGAIRGLLRNPNFRLGMRIIALLQFGMATILCLIALWLRLG